MKLAMARISISIAIAASLTASMPVVANIPGATATTGVGGRAAVFDEAFVAIADDASAIYWNPAGIISLQNHCSLTLSHNSLFTGLFDDLQRDFLSLVYSRRYWGIGGSLDILGTNRVNEADDDGKILQTKGSYSEMRTSFSLSTGSTNIASIGLTGNCFHIRSVTSPNMASLDIGILCWPFSRRWRPQLQLCFGAALRNLYHSLDIPWQCSLAVALQWSPRWDLPVLRKSSLTFAGAFTSQIASDRTPKVALGIELGPDAPNLKLQFGTELYPSVSDSFNWKLGIRIGVSGWWFNYAREQAKFLGGSNRATIDLGFNKKFIQDVTIHQIEAGKPYKISDNEFETTAEIAITIYPSNDISLAEVQRSGLQLAITDRTDKVIDNANYNEMKVVDGYAPRYTFRPVRDWLGELGSIQLGEYTIELSVNNKKRWEGKFKLRYNSEAQDSVKKAYQSFEGGNLKDAEDKLLKAAHQDSSYPDTYYVAGLVSELSDDFLGARQCYEKAIRLSGKETIDFQGESVNLRSIIDSQYLQTLIEQQNEQERQGIQLYERLR